MSRRVLTLSVFWLVVALIVLVAPPVSAQEQDTTEGPVTVEEVNDVDDPVGEIIPKPNSGAAPTNAGDRGGSYQLLILGLLVLFAVIAVTSVVRQGRRTLAERGG